MPDKQVETQIEYECWKNLWCLGATFVQAVKTYTYV
jgi:hypothetical protein